LQIEPYVWTMGRGKKVDVSLGPTRWDVKATLLEK